MRIAQDIFSYQQFGGRMGFGRAPALLLVDFTVGFNDPEVLGGGNITAAIESTEPLLDKARSLGLPIAHTKLVYAKDGADRAIPWMRKVPRLQILTDDNRMSQLVPTLSPREGEIVVVRRLPSAFFGTDLASLFVARGVDTVIIAGCTTSGCVRQSTVDAMCYGFRPIVVEECVGDRAHAPHLASLFDLRQKYADVISRVEAIEAIENVVRNA